MSTLRYNPCHHREPMRLRQQRLNDAGVRPAGIKFRKRSEHAQTAGNRSCQLSWRRRTRRPACRG